MKTKSTIKAEIERIVNKYPYPDSKELFRAELQYLVALAEKQGMIEMGEKLTNKQEKEE